MGKLEELRVSLLDMTPEEVREKIRFVREDRRLSKHTEKMPKVKRQATANKTMNLIKGLTAEQRAKLLKELGG